jgi:serine/threonine protein phosphatase PrpC
VAAEYVSGQVHTLFQEGGLQRTAAALQEMRTALLEKPLKIDEAHSAMLRNMLEEIARQKFQSSYQTTFVAVCLKRGETNPEGMICVKAIGCGDSALFIFREDGELLYNNMNLNGELEQFKHGSAFTLVLPDSLDTEAKNVLVDFQEYPEDVHLLLCSDGLYDSFTNFREIREWLRAHRAELLDSELSGRCLSERHHELSQGKGDDDISFIWLYPNKTQEVTEVEGAAAEGKEASTADMESSKSVKSGFFAKLFKVIFRLYVLGAR